MNRPEDSLDALQLSSFFTMLMTAVWAAGPPIKASHLAFGLADGIVIGVSLSRVVLRWRGY